MSTYTKPQIMAIGVGIVAGGAALAILLQEPVVTGRWRLEHFLLPAIVAIAIEIGRASCRERVSSPV